MADRRNITDPKALRALAHPLRWKLLEIVAREGTATATQCAEETGESVANCSYHLNTLAKYKYVEHAEGGQGREKPWQLVSQGQGWDSSATKDQDFSLAANAATGAFLDYTLTQMRERHLTEHLEPADWQEALGVDNTNDYLTAAEVKEVRDTIRELMNKFQGRRTDPSLRPEGARFVNLFFSTTVTPDKP
ncbi:helix-turn-helix domain-containing protein [Actinophytocola sp.]|uniref:winged helix-turn-helix domain-containing protein n=1 Tax=Actinophytocola sp. TaxID=1872138 RepID=UPI002ED2CE0D